MSPMGSQDPTRVENASDRQRLPDVWAATVALVARRTSTPAAVFSYAGRADPYGFMSNRVAGTGAPGDDAGDT
jgi:hypothetical protein